MTSTLRSIFKLLGELQVGQRTLTVSCQTRLASPSSQSSYKKNLVMRISTSGAHVKSTRCKKLEKQD